jgi:hypothetical protein
MFFVRHPSPTPTESAWPAKTRLVEYVRGNWLFVAYLGALGLAVLCGLW